MAKGNYRALHTDDLEVRSNREMTKLTNLQSKLKDPSLLVTKGYLAGEWTDGQNNATFDVINPSKGDVIAK